MNRGTTPTMSRASLISHQTSLTVSGSHAACKPSKILLSPVGAFLFGVKICRPKTLHYVPYAAKQRPNFGYIGP
ncbi:hypothetical protein BJ508DRAFT_331261 [Ascobolus immersus RN42]|uniref:Uncharacterized protein n=1 Tax=Ascobolus immersus RN42 TaxID=1160509 RepID=A0A3N4HR33_ASCIM|nr:hypothetical protein BJ508DRAFT_331261 [Ascobolus immersus RN42]